MASPSLSPAARAFDAIADRFDERFGEWRSVAAQRGAVRARLTATFAPGSRLLEIGGGTGDDALFMADHGCEVLMTDVSPAMVWRAAAKFAGKQRLHAEEVGAEALASLAGGEVFDGAWSNFAGLNCVPDLAPVTRELARLIRPGGAVLLVLFGTFSPGEAIVEALRGRPKAMFRRFAAGPVPARLGGEEFSICYHRAHKVRTAMAPWFDYAGQTGIGVFVPPSAAEPWISRHPRLLALLESLDSAVSQPLAALGDHVLYHFVRRTDC